MSWFQPEPVMSLELLDASGAAPGESLVDVGGGASLLVDRLVDRGWADVTVLDVSAAALSVAQARLPDDARVTWVCTDLLVWRPARRFGVWHDRAVFHFLVDGADRARYADLLRESVVPGGHVIIGTFAEDGPLMCSGLAVARYTAEALAEELGSRFAMLDRRRHIHVTPAGAVQPFTWVLARYQP